MNNPNQPTFEALDTYVSRKIVGAARILTVHIQQGRAATQEPLTEEGSVHVEPEIQPTATITTEAGTVNIEGEELIRPFLSAKNGDWFILYDDSYMSRCPDEVFQQGYLTKQAADEQDQIELDLAFVQGKKQGANEAEGKRDLNPDLKRIFSYHKPQLGQPERYELIRDTGGQLAQVIAETCPQCEDSARALAKVREAVMWANASIAINE